MSLIKTIGVVFFFNILEYLLAPVSTIIISKNLSVSEFGVYSFILTVYSLVVNFSSLGLGQFNYKMIPGRPEKEQYSILGRTLAIETIFSLVAIVLAFFLIRSDLLRYGIVAAFLLRIPLGVANNELIRFFGFQKKNIAKAAIAFIDQKIWIPLLLVVSLAGRLSVGRIIWLQAAGSFIAFLIIVFALNRLELARNICLDPGFIRKSIKYSAPLIVVDLGMYFLEMGSRYILKAFTDDEAIGLYSFSYSWFSIIFRFGMLLFYILQPYISQYYYEHQKGTQGSLETYRKYLKLAVKYSSVFLASLTLFYLVNYESLILLVGKADYLQTKTNALLLAPYPIFMFLAYVNQIVIILTGDTKSVPKIYAVMVAVNIALNALLIPILGYEGSAIASSASYFVLFLLFSRNVDTTYTKIDISVKEILSIAAAMGLFLALSLFLKVLDLSIWLRMAAAVLSFPGALLVFGVLKKEELRLLRKN